MDELNEIRSECLNSLLENTDNIMKYIDNPQTKSNNLKTMQSLVKKYCILDYQTQVCEEALNNCIEESIDVKTLSNIDDKFVKILKSLVSKRPNVENHAAMIEFKNKLEVQNNNNDNLNESDVIETESSQAFIDPITKKRIITPVRNKNCGHVYEKTSITAMIKKNVMFKCPVMGCANRQVIQKGDIVVDDDLRMRLTQMTENSDGESD